tara:strand:+ start:947 stop:1138 length:192 start_codon:yes stop_codon:yes gene_type:complete
MPKHRKTWNKTKIREILVGNCRYCEKEIINTDSFVSFYKSGHAHYECMRKADDDKTYENEVKT